MCSIYPWRDNSDLFLNEGLTCFTLIKYPSPINKFINQNKMRLCRRFSLFAPLGLLLCIETIFFIIGGKARTFCPLIKIGTLMVYAVHVILVWQLLRTQTPLLSRSQERATSLPSLQEPLDQQKTNCRRINHIYPVELRHYQSRPGRVRPGPRGQRSRAQRKAAKLKINRPSTRFGTFGILSEMEP